MNGSDSLYTLLPAVYRIRDVAQGEPLRALLAVMQAEFDRVDADIARLYDDWFIETCEEWVVPYLADLLGVRSLPPEPAVDEGGKAAFSRRAYVANTLAYRRRKGTAAVLEQLARDVTGWNAHAVEYLQRLAVTQHMNHVRRSNICTVNLRDADGLERIPTPFETTARTAEVRHIDNGRGKYNLPQVGLFLWRLQAYAVTRVTPRPVASPADGRYRFHPGGLDAPLFVRPQTETDLAGISAEVNVPGPLRRRALHDELTAPDGISRGFLAPDGPPAFEIFVARTAAELVPAPIPSARIAIGDLGDLASGDWPRPPAGKDVAVDPVRGRLSFPAAALVDRVEVSYAYGYAADVGGGPYERAASVARWRGADQRRIDWQVGVTASRSVLPSSTVAAPLFADLRQAIAAWNAHVAALPAGAETFGVIAVMDSATYRGALAGGDRIVAPPGARLALVAADWPRVDAPGLPPSQLGRRIGELIPDGRRPHVLGDIEIEGGGEAIFDGLLIEGRMTILPGDLLGLTIHHCTLVPSSGGLTVQASALDGNDRLDVTLLRTISGPMQIADTVHKVTITTSILDSGSAAGMAGADALTAPETELESVTVFGLTRVRVLHASNTLFGGAVVAERRQQGCVRFSYLAPGSAVPRRYRCQPESAVAAQRVVPRWSSVQFGDPGYGQLAASCPCEIARGAEDGNEMGVFRSLQQAHRIAALRDALDEYLRFGLEAGVFFVD